jgi:hypothetical protein
MGLLIGHSFYSTIISRETLQVRKIARAAFKDNRLFFDLRRLISSPSLPAPGVLPSNYCLFPTVSITESSAPLLSGSYFFSLV